jgi:PAS domain S-box-containing protein
MRTSSEEAGASPAPVQSRLREALSILDAVADCIVIVDEVGTVVDINAAAERVLGGAAQDAIGQPLERWIPALEPLLPPEKMLQRSTGQGGLDADVQGRAGERIPVHITVSKSVKDGAKQYVLAIRDFSAVQQAQNRLLETERLAAIGETMTALAHESRNALQRMQSCLTLLRMRCDDGVRELIDDMEDAQDQLQRLYEEVRSFAAPLQLKLRKVDLHRLLDKTWEQLRVQWEPKRLSWTVRRAADVDTVLRVDAARLGQVFMNVLENAIQASPEGAEVFAEIENADATNAAVAISIQDEGPGIPESLRLRVFDLLYTTKQGGTGMGLVIAQRIVREHRGQITLEDASIGARVRIALPRRAPAETDS